MSTVNGKFRIKFWIDALEYVKLLYNANDQWIWNVIYWVSIVGCCFIIKKKNYKLFAIIDCWEDKEFVFKMINFYWLKDTDCKTVVQIYSLWTWTVLHHGA